MAMREVNEVRNVATPNVVNRTHSVFGTWGMGEGKTVAKRKKNRGIIEADANASRPHRYPQPVVSDMLASPRLMVQVEMAKEKIPKYRLVKSLGLLVQTPIPRDKFASAARSKRRRCPLIAVIRLW